jgi:hypothetical protein
MRQQGVRRARDHRRGRQRQTIFSTEPGSPSAERLRLLADAAVAEVAEEVRDAAGAVAVVEGAREVVRVAKRV